MIQSNGEQSLRRATAANELTAWLKASYGPDSWLNTPLGGWEPSTFYLDLSGDLPDSIEGWPPYSWDPLDDWLGWIEETKLDHRLHNDERRMRVLNALAVLQGQLAGTEAAERIVALAEAEMRQARANGAVDDRLAMLIDPPTPFQPLGEWLEFLEDMRTCAPSSMQEEALASACKAVLMKVAIHRAAQLDPSISSKFWLGVY